MADPQAELIKQLEQATAKAESSRLHTQVWYARRYGKVQDWARKRLPEPWQTEFFNCVANGTWGHDDVGEPYMSQVGRIVPSGYFKMDSATEQLLHDQTTRAELAEARNEALLQALKEIVDFSNAPAACSLSGIPAGISSEMSLITTVRAMALIAQSALDSGSASQEAKTPGGENA